MRNTKEGAFKFTAALSSGNFKAERKPPFEPTNESLQPESNIQSVIIDYLILEQALGNLFFQRTNNAPVFDNERGIYRAMAKGQKKGFPDIFVMKDGRAIFLEVKTGKGRQSQHQVEMQAMLEAQGAEYYVVRSLDYVKAALEKQAPPKPKETKLPF